MSLFKAGQSTVDVALDMAEIVYQPRTTAIILVTLCEYKWMGVSPLLCMNDILHLRFSFPWRKRLAIIKYNFRKILPKVT